MCDQHDHSHGHDHHHEHNGLISSVVDSIVHSHSHSNIKDEELKLIDEFCAIKQYKVIDAINCIRKLSSPVDCYENVPKFKKMLNYLSMHLMWGRKARHLFKHAYVQRFGPEEGAFFTIVTDHDLSQIDLNYPWASYDLFEGE